MGDGKPLETLNLIDNLILYEVKSTKPSISKAAAEEGQQLICDVSTDLTLHQSTHVAMHANQDRIINDDPINRVYNIKKKLTVTDVGGNRRLMLPSDMVKRYVLPCVDVEFKRKMKSKKGQQVTIRDMDTGTEHELKFKYFVKSSKAYVLNGKWGMEFVRRRGLNKDDEVGLY